MKTNKILSTLLILGSIGLSAVSILAQKGWPTTATITWSQQVVQSTSFASGQASSFVTFTSNREVQNLTLHVTGEAARFIWLNPQSLVSVSAASPNSLNIQFVIPSDTANGTYEGKVFATAGTRTLTGELQVRLQVESNSVSVPVDTTGGTVDLPQIATVTFPSGAFPNGALVTLSRITSPKAQADFEDTAHLFSPGPVLPYQIKIDSGAAPGETSFEITARVPDSFIQSLPANAELQIFAQILQEGGEETLDHFELIDSTFDPVGKTVKATLPANALTIGRTGLSNEAIIIVGTTPTRPTSPTSPSHTEGDEEFVLPQSQKFETAEAPKSFANRAGTTKKKVALPVTAAAACEASTIGPPLNRPLEVTTPFSVTPLPAPRNRAHYGTDYEAADGTEVISAADGIVNAITLEQDRNTGRVKGWGQYVVIEHTDGSKTLYAHLTRGSTGNLGVGQSVTRGQRIAMSDSTGDVRGAHLHFEYIPNGTIFGRGSKIDPHACIGVTTGSLVVRDNGTLADDAFAVEFNNVRLGQTQIGGSGSFAVNNLRPGTFTLRITAVIAPDNVGTFEIILSDGLTFLGGGTTTSGTLAQGASATFSVVVPANRP